jgi:hypothetical protein
MYVCVCVHALNYCATYLITVIYYVLVIIKIGVVRGVIVGGVGILFWTSHWFNGRLLIICRIVSCSIRVR